MTDEHKYICFCHFEQIIDLLDQLRIRKAYFCLLSFQSLSDTLLISIQNQVVLSLLSGEPLCNTLSKEGLCQHVFICVEKSSFPLHLTGMSARCLILGGWVFFLTTLGVLLCGFDWLQFTIRCLSLSRVGITGLS